MKKSIALSLAIAILAFALAGCGGKKDGGDSSTSSGKTGGAGAASDLVGDYICTSYEVGDMKLDGTGEWMSIKDDGRGIVCIAEKQFPFSWSMEGNIITIEEDVGLTYKATYEDGVVIFDTGMLYFFEKE